MITRRSTTCAAVLLAFLLASGPLQAQNKRDLAVRQDKQKLSQDDSWFYDDLDTAL